MENKKTETMFSDFVYHTATIQLLCMFTKMPMAVDIKNDLWDVDILVSKGVMSILQAVPGWWNPPSPYYSARFLQGGGPVR